MNTKFLKDLKETTSKEVGGKGYSLSKIYSLGYNVPNAFVVFSCVFDEFLIENKLLDKIKLNLSKVNLKEPKTIKKASDQIQELFLKTPISSSLKQEIISSYKKLKTQKVAIRSSATAEDSKKASWAGQLDTFLYVSKKDVIESIKKCWASLYNERAIYYRFLKKQDKKDISVAVVVQKMVDSKVSGVSFSVNPVTKDKTQIIIESAYGLGEAIVSGQISTDCVVVSKKSLKILEKNIVTKKRALYKNKQKYGWKKISSNLQKKQSLTDQQIKKISIMITELEKINKCAVDIEWTLDQKIYLLQVRPITNL